jgi:hypothetical protein
MWRSAIARDRHRAKDTGNSRNAARHRWSASCSIGRMLRIVGCYLLVACAALMSTAPEILAQTETPAPAPRVRPMTADGRALLDELVDRSPTARALVDRLQQSDVIVYVRFRPFPTELLDGRIGILPSDARHRFLVVELACVRTRVVSLATLAHELHHALEIAEAPQVVDARTLFAHYARIGNRAGRVLESETFETREAAETGRQVRRELTGAAARTAQ